MERLVRLPAGLGAQLGPGDLAGTRVLRLQVLGFHTGLATPHSYQSEPWSWPLLLRPVAFFWETPKSGCVATRDWRAGAVLLGYAVGWLPWFYWAIADNRTMYLFYMIPMVPFMILAIVLAAGLVIGKADAAPNRRAVGAAFAGAFMILALINFAWLHPVLVAEVIPHAQWWARMLFPRWA
ncbi:hypothetical protein [Streptosporangium roseum]|uniref:hypothetical protein n=1 Tax=Streptosporangium roseum TaxID=2001 RepID=UPI000690E10C